MKLSEQWLREWVAPQLSTGELAHQITMAGLEVDSVEPVASDFSGVVVAEIVTLEAHPDADKLNVCQVSDGSEKVQVVCGAANARVGLRVPFAQIGAVLPDDFKIKKAKLRGVESQGMLCAEQELGLSENSDGLMELSADAPLGEDIRDYLNLNDQIIDIDLTPNRADCLSVLGVAREVALLNKMEVSAPEFIAIDAQIEASFPVEISAPEYCPRYVGRVIKGVDISQETPLWMREKLRRSDIRSIDPVVDVTNYVLMELGQPMHAFDLSTLAGGIEVRLSDRGESLELLDRQTVELKENTLVIADADKAVALAGIMGGAATAVSEKTVDIFLESAFFAPQKMAGQARSYGLHTDSSHRFERGVDFELQAKAIERATELLLAVVGGQPGPLVESVSEDQLPKWAPVPLRRSRIAKTLGLELADSEVESILLGLGLSAESNVDGWIVSVPSHRFDIAIEADLMEELARVYGYNSLPVSHIHSELVIKPNTEQVLSVRQVRRHLTARGYQEAVTYSFIDSAIQQKFEPGFNAVALKNPISADMAVMRTSLLPGLVSAVAYNLNRQQDRVRLFEIGQCFRQGANGLEQSSTIAVALAGRRNPESWTELGEAADFYDLKGDLESVLGLSASADAFEFKADQHSAMHPGQTAAVYKGEKQVGIIGTIHPSLQADSGLSDPVYLFELELAAILETALPKFRELSKFPEVRRDLALIVDKSVPAGDLIASVSKEAGEYLIDLRLFDEYQGKGIDPKRKSLALGLTFQHQSRTLNEEEINQVVEQVVMNLDSQFGATLRN